MFLAWVPVTVTDRGGGLFVEHTERLFNAFGWVWRYRNKRLKILLCLSLMTT